MMMASAFETWRDAFMAARAARGEESGFDRFIELLDGARGGGLVAAKALVGRTGSDPVDNGQAEAALSILSEFPSSVQSPAVVEELPRLQLAG